MKEALEKAINLAQKTGDRLIVFDRDSNRSFVVLPIGEYEDMVFGTKGVRGLSEDELLNKINRDIAVWRNEQSEESEYFDQDEEGEDKDEEEYYFEPLD